MSLTQSGNPEHQKAAFWLACMKCQVFEMEECLAKNDIEHFLKEMADCAGVAFDGIRLLSGKDALNVIFSRFAENLPKFTDAALECAPRDTQWYLDKIEKIKKALEPTGLADPCGYATVCKHDYIKTTCSICGVDI